MNLGLGGMSAARGQADEEFFGSVYDQKVILRLIPYIKPYTPLVIVSLVSMLIYTFNINISSMPAVKSKNLFLV